MGSSSYITNLDGEVVQHVEYVPFGEVFLEEKNAVWNTPFLFNGKELDKETGMSYYGARYYESKTSVWISVDPLAEKTMSSYGYCYNNPVNLIDPTGMSASEGDWVPDENGNLIAEKDDDAQTLSIFLGTSETNAQQMIDNQKLTTESNDGCVSVKTGETLKLDNVFTRSINNSTSDLTLDRAIAGTSTTGKTPEDDYNCWGSACAGSQGKEIKVGVGIPVGSIFDANLTSGYISTTEPKSQFGKTVLRFADGENNVQHGAVFYGKSQDGTPYVYTKNGWHLKPEVMKLSDLQTKIPSYGTIQGINTGDSGYYNPK